MLWNKDIYQPKVITKIKDNLPAAVSCDMCRVVYLQKTPHQVRHTKKAKLCSSVSWSSNTLHQTLPIVWLVDYVANSDVLITVGFNLSCRLWWRTGRYKLISRLSVTYWVLLLITIKSFFSKCRSVAKRQLKQLSRPSSKVRTKRTVKLKVDHPIYP